MDRFEPPLASNAEDRQSGRKTSLKSWKWGTPSCPYAQFPVMGSYRLKWTASHWQIHPNVWFLSLHNFIVQDLTKPWNGESMMGVVLRVLSSIWYSPPLGGRWLLTWIRGMYALRRKRTNRRFWGARSNGIMVNCNFQSSEQSQHPRDFQANYRIKLFITGNCT